MRRLVAAVAWDRLRRRTLRIGIAEIIRTVRSVAPAAMTPAPAMPKTILAVALLVTVLPVALIGVRGGVWLRLAAAGNEGWQCVRVRDGDIAALNRRLRIRLLLRLMLRAVLLLIARRKRLRVALRFAPFAAAHCNRGSAGGIVPARRRSGGNNVRRADSNSRPPPDRPNSANRARAGCISPRCARRCRGFSRRARSTRRPASADFGSCGAGCCCCCYARACVSDRFS